MLRLLADENVPASIVQWLRGIGCHVVFASESGQGELDQHWLALAKKEQRLIVTSDKDFGELVYRERLPSFGVVLLRMEEIPIRDWIVRLQEVWSVVEANPAGKFIVITPKRIRVRTLPAP